VDDPFLPDDAGVQPGETARLWERLRYFDFFLKERGRRPEDGLFYFTLGEGEWKRTDVWPPQGQRRRDVFLAGPGQLSFEAPESGGEETYKVDFRAASGSSNRWRTQLDRGAVRYPDRAERDQRLLLYESSPLDEPLELTGSPVLHLYLALDGTDGAVHAYLEAVDEKGTPRMLTEGTLRMLHRAESEDSSPYPVPGPYRTFRRADGMVLTPGEVAEAAIEMLPTSVLIPRGHRLRLALAGADASQFARIPAQGGLSWSVKRGPAFPSRLDLPVIPR
jgi:hypothetical protein